jgi:hypothetical protein
MQFPFDSYHYQLPTHADQGGFGFVRKYDIHTGVDLYCNEGQEVYAMESGRIVNIEKFTGEWAGSPWWNATESILIEGKTGVILYGELIVNNNVRNLLFVDKGTLLGRITPVLKTYKGVTPINMLHMELYTHGVRNSIVWNHNTQQVSNLQDITPYLKSTLNTIKVYGYDRFTY